MEVVLEELTAENFKVFGKQIFTFDHKGNSVFGENGTGKTSLASAWYWLICNKDYGLVDNPNIRNDKAEDSDITRITANLKIDGKPVEIVKSQKFKRSKPDDNGVSKVSTTNTYEVNSVEYGERDFKAKLEEYGVDFEKFPHLSHPDLFVSGIGDKKNRDNMRSILFKMATSTTDKEIADMSSETSDVAKLLEDYTVDEITAMQNATMRKIRENYGKEGEILDAEIRGMSESKTDIDTEALEHRKIELMDEIEILNQEIASGVVDKSDLNKALNEVSAEISNIEGKWKQDNQRKTINALEKLSLFERELKKCKTDIEDAKNEVSRRQNRLSFLKGEAEGLSDRLKMVKEREFNDSEWVFDEDTTICSLCGQKLPEDKIEQLKKDFDKKKSEAEKKFKSDRAEEIKNINSQGKDVTNEMRGLGIEIEACEKRIDESTEKVNGYEKQISEIHEVIDSIPSVFDGTDIPEYQALIEKKESLEVKIAEAMADDVDTSELEREKSKLQAELEDVIAQIGRSIANKDIDKQIAEKKAKKTEYEQQKADCERILYQLSLVSMKKNKMLEDSVNEHFNIVKWKLFDTQKNGEVKDACIPMIDGFRFGQSTNRGREILAKLDIIEGLQNFFDQRYPVFLDNAESLSDVTRNRVKCNHQLISLYVSEDTDLIVQ